MKTIATVDLPAHVQVPSYDRAQLRSKIVHIGFGAFHRAHQALILDRVLEQQSSDWGYCEVNLFGGEQLIKDLRAQDHLFCVAELGAQSTDYKVVSSVNESLHVSLDGTQAIINKMAEPQVAIISMTITEKGYCIESGSGRLDLNNPLVLSDLATPDEPKSALGFIVAALAMRRKLGLNAFSVMSCDNIPENGHLAKAAILDFAKQLDGEFASWIESNVSFPSTMVDRIVPAATPETLASIEVALDVADPVAIACEPFLQWVIEDNFVAGRPQWELGGAQLVDDVIPYEEMKLRMLNGSHSFLAYLGYLAGYPHISDTMADQQFKDAAHQLMINEQATTLSMPEGTDLQAYARLLIERFTNPSLKHRTWQIAMDGSQKLPQRFVDSILYHRERKQAHPLLTLGLAGWIRYIGGVDEQGKAIDVQDPMLTQFKDIYNTSEDDIVARVLSLPSIFGNTLSHDKNFVSEVQNAYLLLKAKGAKQCVASTNTTNASF
ncbi:fructuronate reductase [Alginatibacterium sediminis]|uniref:Fructuronate reductase n=1 Tax=Alginatibacterium sediminis TaxID=2164068 RepID=A0A420EHN1_9ALTE|nr:fructuronate reductase [Alginatibacterium sediminis]RKF20066.1 fructuronate reductase [Alginatibacterium sediminis]